MLDGNNIGQSENMSKFIYYEEDLTCKKYTHFAKGEVLRDAQNN